MNELNRKLFTSESVTEGHPDKISDAECTTRMNEFYDAFYHFTYIEN